MTGRFAAGRVRPGHELPAGKEPLAACWRLAEWPADAARPATSFFSHLPAKTSPKRLVATANSRRWVEHSDRELEEELGSDPVEGRSRRGWNHPVVLVRMADAVLQDGVAGPKRWRPPDAPEAPRGVATAVGVLVRPRPAPRTDRP